MFESSHPFPLQMFDIELDFCEKLGHVPVYFMALPRWGIS